MESSQQWLDADCVVRPLCLAVQHGPTQAPSLWCQLRDVGRWPADDNG